MAEDWAKDVRKYAPVADADIIAGLVRYCGIALRNRDSALVSFSDKTETDRVKANFLKKKLGLTDGDDVLDAAIAKVGEQMKTDRTKNRVTVYYLLADAFGRLEDFRPKTKAKTKSAAPVAEPEVVAAKAKTAAKPKATKAKTAAAAAAPEPVMAVAKPAAPAAPAKRVKTPGLFWPLTAALVAFGGVAALIIAGSK